MSFVSEICSLVIRDGTISVIFDVLFTSFWGLGLICAVLWSCAFEPAANQSSVKLTESALRNEHYKSVNAMAFYAPPGAFVQEGGNSV